MGAVSSEYPCYWTHVHGRHEWTPLVGDPEVERVLHLFPDQPVTCPGLTAEEIAAREAQAAARIERGPVGTLHVDASAPGVTVRGANVYVRPIVDDSDPGAPVNLAEGWTEVGYTEDGILPTEPAESEFSTWSTAIERATMTATLTGMPKAAFVGYDHSVSSANTSLTLTYFACPIEPPRKRRGLTGKRYRIARRTYGRAMRRWRRAGSPMAERTVFVPRARVSAQQIAEGSGRFEAQALAAPSHLSTDR